MNMQDDKAKKMDAKEDSMAPAEDFVKLVRCKSKYTSGFVVEIDVAELEKLRREVSKRDGKEHKMLCVFKREDEIEERES